MNDNERRDRIRKLFNEELDTGKDAYWWLSIADASLPKGQQFLGVIITRAPGFTVALAKTHTLGINPGGEVQGTEIPLDTPIIPGALDRLLSAEELKRLGYA